jgi:hypothetical protein
MQMTTVTREEDLDLETGQQLLPTNQELKIVAIPILTSEETMTILVQEELMIMLGVGMETGKEDKDTRVQEAGVRTGRMEVETRDHVPASVTSATKKVTLLVSAQKVEAMTEELEEVIKRDKTTIQVDEETMKVEVDTRGARTEKTENACVYVINLSQEELTLE